MLRLSAALLDSPPVTDHAAEVSLAQSPRLVALRRLGARAREACQIAFLLVYVAAAMTPQLRRALMGLDRG